MPSFVFYIDFYYTIKNSICRCFGMDDNSKSTIKLLNEMQKMLNCVNKFRLIEFFARSNKIKKNFIKIGFVIDNSYIKIKKYMNKIFLLIFNLCSISVFAQLKVGANSTSISPENNLEIEANSSDKVYVNRKDGRMFIQNRPIASKPDSVLMSDINGEVRQMSITRLLGYLDIDGDGVSNDQDADDDGDGIPDSQDKCPIQYGCVSNPVNGVTHGCPINCSNSSGGGGGGNGNAIISSITNCNTASSGVLKTGYSANGATHTITVTTTTAGTYNIVASSNGVTYAASGSLAVGTYNVVLYATGTPINTGTYNFVLNTTPSCTFSKTVTSSYNATNLASVGWNTGTCNMNSGLGWSDIFTTGWSDYTGNFTLSAGNYNISYTVPFEARGQVFGGAPNKPLGGTLWIRLVNVSTGATYLETSSGRIIISPCTARYTGPQSAWANFSGSFGTQNIPAGTYKVQVKGESFMGGCALTWLIIDGWAACCPYIKPGGIVNISN